VLRRIYLLSLGFTLLASWIAFIFWRFPDSRAFSIDILGGSFGVNAHAILDFLLLCLFAFIYLTSLRNALIVVDVKHSTVIAKK
jgi:hypothetical protein